MGILWRENICWGKYKWLSKRGGVMRGKAYLFVCYLGRVWIDCWKLKHEAGSDMPRAWRCLCRPGGRNRLAHLTCHLSACRSPALFGSFNPLPPHLARHVINPLRGLFTWCRGGFPLAFSLASWREKKLMVQRSTRTRLAWLCLDEKELGSHLGITSVIWFEIVCSFTCYSPKPSDIGWLSLSETVCVLIQVFTTYKSTNDSLF